MSRARNRADGDFGDLDVTNIGAVSLDSIKGDADGNTSLAFSGSDIITITTGGTAAATFNASQAFTSAGRIIIDDTTEATSTTDGSLQTDGGLSIVKDAVFGDDVKLLSDASVLSFGADSDVTLTHVADTGILLNSTMAIQFNDASQFINAPSATVLDINATDEIELNATLLDVNANINVSGTYIGGGLMQTGGSIVIPDGSNIGSASDTDSIAIASDGVITLTQKLIGTELDISGNMDIDGTSNLDVVDIDGAVDMASTLQVDGAITGSSTIQGTTITATTAFVPDASDGAALGTSSLEFSDLFLADGAVISLGDDDDVTLTHVADTGILLSSTDQFQFGDSGTYIHQSADGVLDLVSDNEIELNGTLVDVNANVEISGTTAQVGVSTSTAKDIFNAGMSVKNGATSAGFVEFFEDSDNGTNKVTVIGPASTSDVTLTLPSSAGTIATTATAADEATALAIALG